MRNAICAMVSLVMVLCIMALGTVENARNHPPDPVVAAMQMTNDYVESNASTSTSADTRATSRATGLSNFNSGDEPSRSLGVLSTGFGESWVART